MTPVNYDLLIYPNISASTSKTVIFNHLFHFYLNKCWMPVLRNSVPNMPAADRVFCSKAEAGGESRVLHWWVVLENAWRKSCGSGASWWKRGLVPSFAAVTETGRGRTDIDRLSITFKLSLFPDFEQYFNIVQSEKAKIIRTVKQYSPSKLRSHLVIHTGKGSGQSNVYSKVFFIWIWMEAEVKLGLTGVNS